MLGAMERDGELWARAEQISMFRLFVLPVVFLFLPLVLHSADAQAMDVCAWIDSQMEFTSFDDFNENAPDSCVLQPDFFRKLTQDSDNLLRAGVLSPEAANNVVRIWSSFVPTFTPSIAGVSKNYKCETNETANLYVRMMTAIGNAAKNKDSVTQPAADKLMGGTFLVLSGDDASVDGGLYEKVEINRDRTLSSSTVIAAPVKDSGLGGIAVYTVYIPFPGIYHMFVRARGFAKGGSYKINQNIFGYPAMTVPVPESNGYFKWTAVTTAHIHKAGLLRLMVLSTTTLVQIDTIVLHSEGRDLSEELDSLAISSSGIASGAEEADLGYDPSFYLEHSRDSPSGSILRSTKSGSSPMTFNVYFKIRDTYTLYLLARALETDTSRIGNARIDSPQRLRGGRVWSTGNLTWRAFGSYEARATESLDVEIRGQNIEIAALFLHVNPNLISRGKRALENAAAQSLSFDRVCGNNVVEYREECDSSTGCEECKCATGYDPEAGKCIPVCGDGLIVPGEACDSTLGCSMSCACLDGFFSPENELGCKPVCGDQKIRGLEECDTSMGCSSTCVCEDGYQAQSTGGCEPVCGDARVIGDEECDGTYACQSNCRCEPGLEGIDGICRPVCGDGVVISPEECDGTDHCDTSCTCEAGFRMTGNNMCEAICGDGEIVEGEECDGSSGCSSRCQCMPGYLADSGGLCQHLCGNGVVDIGEQCDGSLGCLSDCTCPRGLSDDPNEGCYEFCGDKVTSGTEECDSTSNCTSDCRCMDGFTSRGGTCRSECGDGLVTGVEECDRSVGCLANCLCVRGFKSNGRGDCISTCGDGIVVSEEVCDSTTGCGQDCTCSEDGYIRGSGQYCVNDCGDGKVIAPEQCDGSPGCSKTCRCEAGFTPVRGTCRPICGDRHVVGYEECDGSSGCFNCRCTVGYRSFGGLCRPVCGDGRVNGGEECDGTPGCRRCRCQAGFKISGERCQRIATCGNRIVEVGEECDGGAGCNTSTCQCLSGFYKVVNGLGCRSQECDSSSPARAPDIFAWRENFFSIWITNTRNVDIKLYSTGSGGQYEFRATLGRGIQSSFSAYSGQKWYAAVDNYCLSVFTASSARSFFA